MHLVISSGWQCFRCSIVHSDRFLGRSGRRGDDGGLIGLLRVVQTWVVKREEVASWWVFGTLSPHFITYIVYVRGNLAEKRQKVGVRKSHFVFGSFELANSSFESPFPA